MAELYCTLGLLVRPTAPCRVKVDAFGVWASLGIRIWTLAASEVVGVDRDEHAVEAIRSKFQEDALLVGDVEHLEQLPLDRTFDVILFGDLIEHLSCPGLALDGIRRFILPPKRIDHFHTECLCSARKRAIHTRPVPRRQRTRGRLFEVYLAGPARQASLASHRDIHLL